jgi:hypothetical protein
MESTENFYIQLGYNLDICITVGMGLIAVGAIMVSLMMLNDAFCENNDASEDDLTSWCCGIKNVGAWYCNSNYDTY